MKFSKWYKSNSSHSIKFYFISPLREFFFLRVSSLRAKPVAGYPTGSLFTLSLTDSQCFAFPQVFDGSGCDCDFDRRNRTWRRSVFVREYSAQLIWSSTVWLQLSMCVCRWLSVWEWVSSQIKFSIAACFDLFFFSHHFWQGPSWSHLVDCCL